jgi:peptide/nickel transport system permease protein
MTRPAQSATVATAAPVISSGKGRSRRRVPLTVAIGGGFLLLLVLAAVFAPVIAPHSPIKGSVAFRLRGIGSSGHLLGTDGQGRDILSRLLWGARPSLIEGFVPVAFAMIVGGLLGIVAGLSTWRINNVIMRSLDVLYAFPAVLLAIAITAALGAGISNVIIALSVVLIAPIARVTQTEVARIRETDFMEAARASGASWGSIALRQVVPAIAPGIVVYCTALVGLAIVYAGGLSFLGIGVPPPHAEWGVMLNDLRQNLYDEPVLALVPAITIFLTSIAFNVLGDGLRDLLDVRSEVLS